MVDTTAVARVIGISATFADLRTGSANNLPMHLGVVGQGSLTATYPLTKKRILSAAQAGALYGYGSPIHLAIRQIMPPAGDGIGSVPVTVHPLPADPGGGAAPSVGTVDVSGTVTVPHTVKARIGGVLSKAFAVAAGALATAANATALFKALGDAVDEVLEMPVTVSYTYGTVTSSHSTVIGGSNGTLTTFTTTGGPVPGVWHLECTAAATNAGTFKLTDPNGTIVSTTVTIGAQVQGGLGFTLADGSTDFGVGDIFTITVPATDTKFTSKWNGDSANDIVIEIITDSSEVTWAITQPTGGLVNPTVTDALDQIGNVWETLLLNCLNIDDTDALDEYSTVGDGRWGDTFHKPFMVFTGNTEADAEDAVSVVSGRQTDRINAQLVAPGSTSLPFVIAARQLCLIARTANNKPPVNYTGQRVKGAGIVPGTDAEQWDFPTRDFAVKEGSSTTELVDGVIQISDVMTSWRPTGEEPPAYRYVVDVIKVMNIIYNLSLIFARADWAGAPLIPDDQDTTEEAAKKPKHAKAEVAGMIDGLALAAIISDPKNAKKTINAYIDTENPKRMNVEFTVPLSGNTQIIDTPFKFGFFYGAAPLAA